MSHGNRVAIVAFGLLAVGIISYYGLQHDPADAGAQVQVADEKAPAPAEADKVNRQDPALTADQPATDDDLAALLERRRERRVVSVDQPVRDLLQVDLLNPDAQPPLTLEQPPPIAKAPSQTPDTPVTPESSEGKQPESTESHVAAAPGPAKLAPRQPTDGAKEPIDHRPITEADPVARQPGSAAAADQAQVRPMPHDVLIQQAPKPGDGANDTRVEKQVLKATPINDQQQSAAESKNQYTVVSGDSMWKVSKKTLGAGHKWQLIANANPHIDPDHLQPGQVLTIPALDPPAKDREAAAADNPKKTAEDPLGLGLNRDMREITVLDGESLWTIAQREYNDGTRWYFLWQANKDRMKSKDSLRPGQKLRIPPLPEED